MSEAEKGTMRAHDILNALEERYVEKNVCFREAKNGSTWLKAYEYRMDFLAIAKTWSPICLSAFEVKVSRSDFLNDQKWPEYMKLCNRFYWACPTGLIKKEEIDPKCGLVYVNPETGAVSTAKAAPYRKGKPDRDLLMYLILWRLGESEAEKKVKDRKAKQEDMKNGDRLGERFGTFRDEKLDEASGRIAKAEEDAKEAREAAEATRAGCEVLQKLEDGAVDVRKLAGQGLLKNSYKLANLTRVKQNIERLRENLTDILSVMGVEFDEEEPE